MGALVVIERSVATLDALVKPIDSSDGCDDRIGLGVDGGGVFACEGGARGCEG